MKRFGMLFAMLAVAAVIAAAVFAAGRAGEKASDAARKAPTPIPTNAPAPSAPPAYTLHRGLTEFPANWNPHCISTDADAEMLQYLSAGLYAYDYNEDRSGVCLKPCMAAAAPVDVTAEYAGAFGLSEGDTCRAWSISLREDLCWQDGSPITAFDFVASAFRLLDPEHPQPRSSLLCSGPLALAGAREYRDSAAHIHLENAVNAFYTLEDLSPGEDGIYRTPEGQPVSLALDFPLEHLLYGKTLRFYVETYGTKCFDLSTWRTLLEQMDADGLVPLTDESLEAFLTLTTGNPNWGDSRETVPAYLICDEPTPGAAWAETGIFARSSTELVLVLEKPLAGFGLLSALTESWLVCCELYDECAAMEDGVYVNTYGTSPETTASCGPYVLTEYTPGSSCTLRRNPRYFENGDPGADEWYETTEIRLTAQDDDARRMELFLGGALDQCAPDPAAWPDAETCRTIPGDTTYLLVLNSDFSALEKRQAEAGEQVNKTILTLPDFRRAISLALDREAFCRTVSPQNRPAMTLFTALTLADPELGIPYRNTARGQEAAAGYAEGNGYDPAEASRLFTKAWKEALAEGLVTEDSVVELCIGSPSASAEYCLQGWNVLTEQLTSAVDGTPLEDRLRFVRADGLDAGDSAALWENRADLLFGVGWAGNALDPYAVMAAYVSPEYRFDSAWDTAGDLRSLQAGGNRYTASVDDWYALLLGESRSVLKNGGEAETIQPGSPQCPFCPTDILAVLEKAVLDRGCVIPLSESCTRELESRRLRFPSEEYFYGVGFGGVKYLRYTCPDAEWAAHTAACGGHPNE